MILVLSIGIHSIDLDRKCDILVSEILDTALLGEGVLVAVRDAKVYLYF